jgi:uncharacterized protein (TIGR03083 family)
MVGIASYDPFVESPSAAVSAAWRRVLDLLPVLTTDDWYRPTPCTGWSVKDVLGHLGHTEGTLIHDFPQPDPPEGWTPEGKPLDQITGLGVASRREWPPARVTEEIERCAIATVERMGGEHVDWETETATFIGPAPLRIAMEMRVTDLVIHYCDLCTAIGRGLEPERDTPDRRMAIGRAVRLTPWAWAKQVGAGDGEAITLRLTGPAGVEGEVSKRDGRAALTPAPLGADPAIEGSGLAYLLAVSGRHGQAAAAGGLVARTERARQLLERFRIVG